MEIPCPKCGELIVVNITGRKRHATDVSIVCDAYTHHKTCRAAAKYYERITGTTISPALIHRRIGEEADRRGMTRTSLINELQGVLQIEKVTS